MTQMSTLLPLPKSLNIPEHIASATIFTPSSLCNTNFIRNSTNFNINKCFRCYKINSRSVLHDISIQKQPLQRGTRNPWWQMVVYQLNHVDISTNKLFRMLNLNKIKIMQIQVSYGQKQLTVCRWGPVTSTPPSTNAADTWPWQLIQK